MCPALLDLTAQLQLPVSHLPPRHGYFPCTWAIQGNTRRMIIDAVFVPCIVIFFFPFPMFCVVSCTSCDAKHVLCHPSHLQSHRVSPYLLVQLGQGNQEVGFGGSALFLAIYPYAEDMSDYPHKATSTPGSHLDNHFCCE